MKGHPWRAEGGTAPLVTGRQAGKAESSSYPCLSCPGPAGNFRILWVLPRTRRTPRAPLPH